MKRVGVAALAGMLACGLAIWGVSHVHAQGQTTAEERDHIRDLILERDAAGGRIQAIRDKFQKQIDNSEEVKVWKAIQDEIDATVKALESKKCGSAKRLEKDPAKGSDFLRCVDKPRPDSKFK